MIDSGTAARAAGGVSIGTSSTSASTPFPRAEAAAKEREQASALYYGNKEALDSRAQSTVGSPLIDLGVAESYPTLGPILDAEGAIADAAQAAMQAIARGSAAAYGDFSGSEELRYRSGPSKTPMHSRRLICVPLQVHAGSCHGGQRSARAQVGCGMSRHAVVRNGE